MYLPTSFFSTIAAFVLLVSIARSEAPVYAPIPAGSNGPSVGPDGYRTQYLGGGAYMLTDGEYQSMFLVSTNSVIVIDAPPTLGHKLLYGIGNVTSKPVSHMIYSHAHADHIGAASLFGHSIDIIAHKLTREIMEQTPDSLRPLPTSVFDQCQTLQIGNQTLELSYKGNAHQPGNIFIYAPKQKVLMVVDIVFPGWVPFAYLGEAQFVPGYIKAYDQILEYDFEVFVGGHLTRSGTKEDVLVGQEYINDLKTNCEQAILLSGLPPNDTNTISAYTIIPPIQEANPGNPWAVFNGVLDTLSTYCMNVTNEKWLGVLGAADVYGFSNAYQMLESLRIDADILGPFGVTD